MLVCETYMVVSVKLERYLSIEIDTGYHVIRLRLGGQWKFL